MAPAARGERGRVDPHDLGLVLVEDSGHDGPQVGIGREKLKRFLEGPIKNDIVVINEADELTATLFPPHVTSLREEHALWEPNVPQTQIREFPREFFGAPRIIYDDNRL
jgi:hypothetical protein